jgi:uncharacterized protein
VKAGDLVRVKVLEVDAKRRRIALSMRLDAEVDRRRKEDVPGRRAPPVQAPRSQQGGALADALATALKRR